MHCRGGRGRHKKSVGSPRVNFTSCAVRADQRGLGRYPCPLMKPTGILQLCCSTPTQPIRCSSCRTCARHRHLERERDHNLVQLLLQWEGRSRIRSEFRPGSCHTAALRTDLAYAQRPCCIVCTNTSACGSHGASSPPSTDLLRGCGSIWHRGLPQASPNTHAHLPSQCCTHLLRDGEEVKGLGHAVGHQHVGRDLVHNHLRGGRRKWRRV